MAESLAAYMAKVNVKDDRIVSFEGMGLKLDNAETAAGIVQCIETCPHMEILNLAGNTLGVQAAQEIANALQSRPTLKFALWKDMYTGRLRSEIPPSLRALSSAMLIAGTQLVELDLSDNAFGPDGADAIRALLTSPVAYTLQTLKFQNNGLGLGGVTIAECLKVNHGNAKKEGKSLDLRTFIAGRNRLENPGATALGEAFSLLGTLEQIEVIQNGIQFEGIRALAECIKHSPNLRILNLNDNIMTPRGAIAIAKALPFAKKLEVLNIGDCLTKSQGASALAENIGELTNLKELIMSYNEVQAESGAALAQACSQLPGLKVLDLDGNHFGEEGIRLVSDALGARVIILQPGLNNDEGVPSDDEEGEVEEEEEPEKQDSPEKTETTASPFVFGSSSPVVLANTDPNRTFGFGTSTATGGFSFSSLSASPNIFANKDKAAVDDHSFKGAGTALFSSNTNTNEENPEKEPDVQFEPLVQLEKVEVKSGNENDVEVYRHRAKLFRFDGEAKMWKERGVGDIRILQDKTTKKSRLLMRRDIILKICCNHMITKTMEMKPNAGNDKSLNWFTGSDYTEGEPKPEQLALRFKTPDICKEFLGAFLKAQEEMPEPGSTPTKAENKPEPVVTKPEVTFSFASLASNAEKAAFAAKESPSKSPVKVADSDAYRDEGYEPDTQFEPLVRLEKVEHTTGTEGEEERFVSRCKLYRFDKETSQWKERGLGDIQVLWNKRSGKGRILMRREQIFKICCNHLITPEMELKPHQGKDTFWVWHTYADITEEEPRFEQLAARFKTSELAKGFQQAFVECQENIGQVDETEDSDVEEAAEAVHNVAIEKRPGGMSAFLAAQAAKWECGTCGLRNETAADECIACQTANPSAPPKPAASFGASKTPSFGAPGSGITFGAPSTGFTFGASKPAENKPAEPAKPAFTFGAPSSAPAFSFTAPAATATPTFSFGAGRNPAPAAASPQGEKQEDKPSPFAGFSFGGPPKPDLFGTVQSVGTPTPAHPPVDYVAFAKDPTEAVLEHTPKPEEVSKVVDCSDPVAVAQFLGKLSSVTTNKTIDTSIAICDDILASSFTAQSGAGVVTNELLVTMGLIKSEDRDYKPVSDVRNMLRLMSHATKQGYFPENSAQILGAFIHKGKENLANKIENCTDLLNSFNI